MPMSLTPELLREKVRARKEAWDGSNRKVATKQLRALFSSEDCVQFLQPHPSETAPEFVERKARFLYLDHFSGVVGLQTAYVYSGARRAVAGHTEAQDQLLQEALERACLARAQVEWSDLALVEGGAWVRADIDPVTEDLFFAIRAVDQVDFLLDPRSDGRLTFYLERWEDDAGTERYYAQSPTEILMVDGDGNAAEGYEAGPRENPLGRVWAVHFGGRPVLNSFLGDSWMRAPATAQVASLNALANERELQSDQGFSQAVLEGDSSVPEFITDGQSKPVQTVEVGTKRAVQVPKGGDYRFATPGAPLTEVAGHRRDMRRAIYEVAHLPVSLLDETVSQATGIRLQVEFRPLGARTKRIQDVWRPADQSLTATCAELKGLAEAGARGTIEYPETVIPEDKAEKRASDMQEVTANLRTVEDYLRDHRPDLATKAQREAYVRELNKAKEAKMAAFQLPPVSGPEDSGDNAQ